MSPGATIFFSRQAHSIDMRRGARVVESGGLENRCTRKGTVGSNPTLSARIQGKRKKAKGKNTDFRFLTLAFCLFTFAFQWRGAGVA